MSNLADRKMEVFDAIDDFIESLVGPEFFMSSWSGIDGSYEITIAIPKETFCVEGVSDERT